ncbi:Flagellar basal-body rod modification protein FlgD [hydrothermal vent metagenome]|uniref:Flagellar basal-body rod modification protein FlgD n=1 Tax=hydrothermal vent metagenome TaxID=652676 RepID=A0A3B0TV76_9ZZZZ
MSINALASSAAAGTNANTERQLIADNFDTFLKLLTTQLKNQNPLEPLDTNQFTQQLVEFSAVEQAVKSNDLLSKLVAANAASTTGTAIGYIGKSVEASGTATTLKSGNANWTYEINQAAPEASITIRNAAGTIVFTELTELDAGTNTYNWDGTTSSGGTAPEGAYSITIDAKDENGSNISVSTTITGEVTGVEFDGAEPVLIVGTSRINLSSVKSVSAL